MRTTRTRNRRGQSRPVRYRRETDSYEAWTLYAAIGLRVRAWRETQGRSQNWLATQAGISRQTLAALEAGRARRLTLVMGDRLATALGKTLPELMDVRPLIPAGS